MAAGEQRQAMGDRAVCEHSGRRHAGGQPRRRRDQAAAGAGVESRWVHRQSKGVIHQACACFVQPRAILNLVFGVLFIVQMDLDLGARSNSFASPLMILISTLVRNLDLNFLRTGHKTELHPLAEAVGIWWTTSWGRRGAP